MNPNELTNGQILIYTTPDGNAQIEVQLADESVWLPQAMLAELFQTTQQNISVHIANVYEEGELDESTTSRSVVVPRQEGSRTVRREVTIYNLDLIISVGYRVKSTLATRFRIWATERLVEYLVKGFTMDDERLKGGRNFGQDYFDELLARIREIRASEKRFYQKVRDVFTTSVDYDKSDETARQFFQTVQNKLLYAITGFTAAELVHSRANRVKANMGLTTWAGSRVRRLDVGTGKNYLSNEEMEQLNRIVNMYLDYAEDRAGRGIPMTMADWVERLDAFLQFNDREILVNYGSVSMEVAKTLASEEYEAFDAERRKREAIEEDEADFGTLGEYLKELGGETRS